MLNRRDRIDRLDEAISESEKRIADRVLRIASMDAKGVDTSLIRGMLAASEGILAECHRTRRLLIQALQMHGPPSSSERSRL